MQLQGKFLDPTSFRVNTASGDGSTTAFNLTDTPIAAATLYVIVNGLIQTPVTDYSLAGATVTFTAAPSSDSAITFYYIRKES